MDGTIRRWVFRLWPAVLLVAGCSYRGNIDDPVVRRLSWFSYIGGDDIRAACGPGTLDRYRLVYNANYEEQVRSYEVVADGATGAILVARAFDPAPFLLWTADGSLPSWGGARSEARLDGSAFAAFRQAMVDSGFFEPPPAGLRLFSGGFWWVATGCVDETFHVGAWRMPQDRPEDPAFSAILFAYDATGVAVNPPRPVAAEARFGPRGNRDDWGGRIDFMLEVTAEGVGGGPRGLF